VFPYACKSAKYAYCICKTIGTGNQAAAVSNATGRKLEEAVE